MCARGNITSLVCGTTRGTRAYISTSSTSKCTQIAVVAIYVRIFRTHKKKLHIHVPLTGGRRSLTHKSVHSIDENGTKCGGVRLCMRCADTRSASKRTDECGLMLAPGLPHADQTRACKRFARNILCTGCVYMFSDRMRLYTDVYIKAHTPPNETKPTKKKCSEDARNAALRSTGGWMWRPVGTRAHAMRSSV